MCIINKIVTGQPIRKINPQLKPFPYNNGDKIQEKRSKYIKLNRLQVAGDVFSF
jgi:hypothetical protein